MSSTDNENITIIVASHEEKGEADSKPVENVEMQFPKRCVKYFGVIGSLVDDLSGQGEEDVPIPVPNVTHDIMVDFIDFTSQPCFDKYMAYYDNSENWDGSELKIRTLEWNTLMDEGAEYVRDRYDSNRQQYLRIVRMSDYLGCIFISKACARYGASVLKGKNEEQMREAFGLPPRDHPPTQEELKAAIAVAKSRGIDIKESDYVKKDKPVETENKN